MAVDGFDPGIERWAALRTPGRWEKSLAETLGGLGVPVFLPLKTKLNVVDGRQRRSRVPVFGGYLFCSELHFIGNSAIPGGVRAKVSQVLRPPDPGQLRRELLALAELMTDRELVQEKMAGGVGDIVKITGGAMAGYTGPIIRVEPNQFKIVIEVSFIGAKMDVMVDEALVERVIE